MLYSEGWQLGGRGQTLAPKLTLLLDNQGARAFIDRGRGCMQKQQSVLVVSLQLVIGGLTTVILVVSGTVNLLFQACFYFSHFLRPALGIVAVSVMTTV